MFIVVTLLCCVISVQIEAHYIGPNIKLEEKFTMRIRGENDVNGAETVQLNGSGLRAPAWPEANSANKKMFLIPTKLKEGDRINVSSLISSDPQWISIGLLTERDGPNGSKEPDHTNTASQLEIHFPFKGSSEEKIVLKTIFNDNTEEFASNLMPSDLIPDLIFSVHIEISSNGNLTFHIGESFIDIIRLKHRFDDIRYLILNGDVEKVNRLDFEFA